MAYQFRLESVLSLRRTLEEQAQLKLAREQAILQRHIRRHEELVTARQAMIHELDQKLRGDMTASVYFIYLNSLRNAAAELKKQENVIASQRKVVERERDELVVRMRSRKVLEKYRERDHSSYLQTEGRKEQSEYDELAVLRHGRDFS